VASIGSATEPLQALFAAAGPRDSAGTARCGIAAIAVEEALA